ncbi:MAG: nuclear transport factor 2 family protein [Deltaproteobacteria bacterium]|nr:nuclear transport factor 2 family protein [Deltaproteobacteria bacterium]
MGVEQNKAKVKAFFDALERGDRDALVALFHPELRWSVPKGAVAPYGGMHHGAAKIADMMLGATGTAFVPGSQRIAVRLMMAEGDVVIAETKMTAKRPPRDGKPVPDYENHYVFVVELEGDRIVEIREHVDTRYAAEAFGGA